MCRLWGDESPQKLWERIDYQSWIGWVQYSNEEPWGEIREDMRMASVVANLIAMFCKTTQETPGLIYPYLATADDVADEAHRVLEYVKAKYGTLSGQNGDSPGD